MNAKQIKAKLKKYEISQKEAARVCGVEPTTVSLVLSGVHKSERLLLKLQSLIELFERNISKTATR